MSSRRSTDVERRHVVAVEDQLYHTTEMLEAIAAAAPELLSWLTVCAIEAPGTDTVRTVAEWLTRYDRLQVAAQIERSAVPPSTVSRLVTIGGRQLDDAAGFARLVASLLRPGGILVQDVHLDTLRFVPRERWWESIYTAATIRGMFAERPPVVRFLSNKRGYSATFGRDLIEAGFDPRDVMDKSELAATVVPTIERELRDRFPLALTLTSAAADLPVAADERSRRDADAIADLVEWEVGGRLELGGRLLKEPVAFRSGAQEAVTWQALIDDRFTGGVGVPVLEVGRRLADAGVERAEASNLAARHIHGLRARLADPGAIVTANHTYRLDDRLVLGRVRPR